MSADYTPPFLDSNECTGCGECVEINSKIFAWNDKKQAYIVDPTAGSYKDIVKSAEKCAARCIKPGTPANPNEKGVEKLYESLAVVRFNLAWVCEGKDWREFLPQE